MDVSVILPTRNEKASIGKCIEKVKQIFKKYKIKGEIIVSDSSIDGSDKIAKKLGAKVIKHNKKGFGIAIKEGVRASKGKVLLFSDADCSYDLSEIPKLLKEMKQADLVLGSRLKGEIDQGAMPFSHKYIGNPGLTYLFNKMFKTSVSDVHSGLRAIRAKKLKILELQSNDFTYYTEMLIKAQNKKLKISEIPIKFHKRNGKPHLKTISDGFKNLKLMIKLK